MSDTNKHATGPRTPEGKARSSRNACKHGLTAKDVVVQEHEREDFEDLRDSLQNELEPEGALEQLTFNQIVHAAWNLRRFHRLESAMLSSGGLDPITDASATAHLDRLSRYARQAERSYYRATRELRTLQNERAAKEKEMPRVIEVRWIDSDAKQTPDDDLTEGNPDPAPPRSADANPAVTSSRAVVFPTRRRG